MERSGMYRMVRFFNHLKHIMASELLKIPPSGGLGGPNQLPMIEILPTVRTYLVEQNPLTDLVSQRIYGSQHLPAGYKPTVGPALLFNVRGGGQDYTGHLLSPSLQFRAYALSSNLAWQVNEILFDVFNDTQTYFIVAAYLETLPVVLQEPSTGWYYSLSFYFTLIRNS